MRHLGWLPRAAGVVLGVALSMAAAIAGCSDGAVAPAGGTAGTPPSSEGSVTPSPGGVGNVRVDFSACAVGAMPLWFAFQDGAGEWTRIVGADDVYRFDVASAKGGYAYATMGSGRVLNVAYATRHELTRSPIAVCRAPGQKAVSGRFAGLGAGHVAYVGLGEPNPDPERAPRRERSFTLTGIDDGAQDLVAYRSESPRFAGTERVVIRRDQNVVHGGTLGVVDFDGAESFEPATASLTVTGAGGLPVAQWMSYFTGPTCALHDLYYDESGGTAFTMRGIPAALQRATDMHRVDVYTTAGGGFRAASEVFHALADRVVAFPQELPAPAISAPPGRHRRLAASLTLPAEYRNGEVLLLMYAYGEHGAFAYVRATPGWLGGPAVTLAVPDLGGAAGWHDAFLPPPDASVGWIVQATGSTGAPADGGVCAENARFVLAYVGGRS